MSEFNRCRKCDEYIWIKEKHECVTWHFKNEYYGDEWKDRNFKKYWDHEQVAESLASDYFFQDPGNLDSFEFDVQVKSPNGEVKRFVVTGEPDVYWKAKETKPPAEEAK